MEYARRLNQAFPGTRISGENYPPPPLNALLSSLLQFVFFAGLICNIFGSHFLPPAAAQWAQNNRGLCIAIPLFANMFAGQLVATGAFEVTYNGIPVFSKLENGQMIDYPQLQRLIQQVVNA
eukprot:GGOE01003680.1.p2 GENE.GGOE01003680.1~~GGOE01003680.1.p2  ORF type:complete len:122 (+),score=40.90 GGOE01003680.1:375-740(+)